MSEWKGKSKGNKTGYKIFIFLINHLGLGFAYFILFFVSFYFFLFSKKEKRAIQWYFRNIHQYNSWQVQVHTFKNFYAIGVALIDKIALLSGKNPNFTFNFDGENYLHKLAAEKQGSIIVGAHIGNWEVAGQLMERIDVPVNIVMKVNEDAAIQEVIEKAMVLKKMKIINLTDDFAYLIEIKKALDNNEFVILHGDRFVNEDNIMERPFMQHKANFPKGPFLLALKFRKPIIFAFAMKESRKHYHFYASEPIYNNRRTEPKNLDIEVGKLIDNYTQNLETMLRKYPDQWFNFYKFWK